MKEAGIIIDKEIAQKNNPKKINFSNVESEYESLSLNKLEEELKKAIKEEDYERASKIRDEIKNRE